MPVTGIYRGSHFKNDIVPVTGASESSVRGVDITPVVECNIVPVTGQSKLRIPGVTGSGNTTANHYHASRINSTINTNSTQYKSHSHTPPPDTHIICE